MMCCRSSAVISEVEGLKVPRAGSTNSAGTGFPSAAARLTIASHPISLAWISQVNKAWRNGLVGSSAAGWYAKRDSLDTIREGESQIKIYIRPAVETGGCLDLEWRGIRASRVNDHVRITRAVLRHRHTRSGS